MCRRARKLRSYTILHCISDSDAEALLPPKEAAPPEDGETAANLSLSGAYTAPVVIPDSWLPGTHSLSPENGVAANYVFRYVPGTLRIDPASMEDKIRSTGVSVVYDGTYHSITVDPSFSPAEQADMKIFYGFAANDCNMMNSPEEKDTGNRTIFYRVTKPGYSDIVGFDTLAIRQRPAEVTSIAVDNKIYDGTLVTQNAKITLKQAPANEATNPTKKDVLHGDRRGHLSYQGRGHQSDAGCYRNHSYGR